MLSIRAETTVSTYGSVEIARLKKKKEEDKQLAVLTNSSFVLLRWLLATLKVFVNTEHSSMKGQVPIKPYSRCFRLPFAIYGMSVPSLHTESTDSVIHFSHHRVCTVHHCSLTGGVLEQKPPPPNVLSAMCCNKYVPSHLGRTSSISCGECILLLLE